MAAKRFAAVGLKFLIPYISKKKNAGFKNSAKMQLINDLPDRQIEKIYIESINKN